MCLTTYSVTTRSAQVCSVFSVSSLPHYWESRHRPDRAEVAEACALLEPFQSLCDVGAGPGPLLPALCSRWPDTPIMAVEPCAEFVTFGAQQFGPRVTWITTCACRGVALVDVDVLVFSHCLSGLGAVDWAPVLIQAVLGARRGVVWIEQVNRNETAKFVTGVEGRDYRAVAEGAGGVVLRDQPCTSNPGWQLAVVRSPGV